MMINSEAGRSIQSQAGIADKVQNLVTPGILASYHATDRLPDGRIVYLRAIKPSDREALRRGFLQLSKASVRPELLSGPG